MESQRELGLADYLRRVHALCFHVRLWEETIGESDRRREAFMADQIRDARQEFSGPLLVVSGGFHSSALAARLEGFACPGADAPAHYAPATTELPDHGIALTSYSYDRLDSLTGYDAGMPSPGFYDHAWRQRQCGEPFSHSALLTELIGELRGRKQVASTADLIAVETSARAGRLARAAARLAARPVGRRDLGPDQG